MPANTSHPENSDKFVVNVKSLHATSLYATSLYSPMSRNVGNYTPEQFYYQLTNDYAEFSFPEMKEIYHYRGMDYWPLLTDALASKEKVEPSDTSCLMMLVSVCPSSAHPPRQWGKKRRQSWHGPEPN